tara:strand:+ start:731 stop:1771 length:1041 start_codon:yes stop_codon:yes gene_type:complete
MASKSSSKRSSKSPRYEGTITVDRSLMGKLIGRGGCNVRRWTSTCRFGTYIKGMSDGVTFKISSYSAEAVKKAARMIKMDEAALNDPNLRSSKPFQTHFMEQEYVAHIVGRDGGGIRAIMDKVGDGCYIVHRDGDFHVTANSKEDVQYAIKLLEQEKDAYIKWSTGEDLEPSAVYAEAKTSKTPTSLRNAFSALDSSDDEESDDDEEPDMLAYRGALAKELGVDGARLTDKQVARFMKMSASSGVSAKNMNQSVFPTLKGGNQNIHLHVQDKPSGAWGKSGLIETMSSVKDQPTQPLKSLKVKVPTPKVDTAFKIDLTDVGSVSPTFNYTFPPGTSWADMCSDDED